MRQASSLDYQKHALKLQKNQMALANNRMEMAGRQPGIHDAEMGLIEDIQQSSQTRKPGWRALLDGMASGLKYGLKSADAEKKRNTYAAMEKMMESFEEAGRQLQRQNERNALRQEEMETKVIPSAIGYLTFLQNNPSYDEAFTNLNGRVEQIKASSLFDGELVALSPRNYEVGIFKERKTGKLQEIPISSLLPPDILKGRPDLNPYERARDGEKMALERQKVDILQKRADASVQQQNSHAEDEEIKTYLELYGLLKDPDTDPTSSAGTGVKSWMAQNVPFAGKLMGKGLAKQQAYSQKTADLKGQAFRKHGYRNQAEFENIHTLPDTLPKEEALKFVEGELRKRGIEIPDGVAGVPTANPTPEQGAGNGGYVKVKDPSTGQVGLLSPEQAKIAISRGGISLP
jgi:hypothetical protein